MHKYQQSIHHIVTSSDKKGIKKRTCIVTYNKSWNMLEIQGRIWKLKKHCFRKQLLNVFQTFTVINIHKWKKVDYIYYCEYLSTVYTFTYISIHWTTYKKYFSFYFYIAKLYTNTFVSVYRCASNFQVEYLHKQVRSFRGQNWVATTHFQLISRGSFR